jgi:hypothetical protein
MYYTDKHPLCPYPLNKFFKILNLGYIIGVSVEYYTYFSRLIPERVANLALKATKGLTALGQRPSLWIKHTNISFFYRCRKRRLKYSLTPEMSCDQTAIGLPPVTSAVFLIAKPLHTTYHLRFIPEGVADVSQIFLRDTHVLPK